jgi:alpha-methylacyl-CoA racemase
MSGPLAGLRVIELSGIGPAPFCAMLLADLGADVVLVDRMGGRGSLAGKPGFNLLNRGKRSIEVDLKHELGADLVLRLVERADVLLEGYRPGVAERLGVGPDVCLARNQRLVYGRMTGWGQHGPLARTAGHDIDYLAISGALHAIGRAGGPPQVPLNLVGDFGGGSLYLAVGVLAALREVERSGRGQVVDAAIVDGAAHLSTLIHGLLAAGGWRDERGVNLLDTGAPFYDVYETSDGKHVAVGPLEPQFFAAFIARLGLPGRPGTVGGLPEQYDVPHWPLLRQRFAEAFAGRTRAEWIALFDGSDACVAPVLSLQEAPEHPHLLARGTFVEHDGVVQPAPAPRFSATPAKLRSAPALPGAHSREVLIDWGLEAPDDILATGVARQSEIVGPGLASEDRR